MITKQTHINKYTITKELTMINQKEFGQNVQLARKAKKLTQTKLAEMLGVSDKYISNIETGRNICGTDLLLALANILETSLDALYGSNLKFNQLAQKNSITKYIQADMAKLNDYQLHLASSIIRTMADYEEPGNP